MALIRSLTERHATMHRPTHPLFTTYPLPPFPYMRTRDLKNTTPIASIAPPPPPPPLSNASTPPNPRSNSLSAMFKSPINASRPPASPALVERFLEEVSKEIEKGLVHEQDEFWPDKGNRNLVLPVPGPVRQASQLITEGEKGKCSPIHKNSGLTDCWLPIRERRKSQRSTPYPQLCKIGLTEVVRELAMSEEDTLSTQRSDPLSPILSMSDSSLASITAPPFINLMLSLLALEYPSTSSLDEAMILLCVINGRVLGYQL